MRDDGKHMSMQHVDATDFISGSITTEVRSLIVQKLKFEISPFFNPKNGGFWLVESNTELTFDRKNREFHHLIESTLSLRLDTNQILKKVSTTCKKHFWRNVRWMRFQPFLSIDQNFPTFWSKMAENLEHEWKRAYKHSP